jgi:hypothetical protein
MARSCMHMIWGQSPPNHSNIHVSHKQPIKKIIYMQETPHLATLQLGFPLGGQGGELLSVLHSDAMQIHQRETKSHI